MVAQRKSKRNVLLTIAGGLLLVALVAAFLFRPSPVLGVDGEALQHSVGGTFGPSESCDSKGDRIWSCNRYDAEMSSGVGYRVKVNSLGCWQGNRMSRAEKGGPPKHLTGCLTIFDYILG